MSIWWLLALVPKNLISRATGWLVRQRWPGPLNQWVVGAFARHFRIRLEEAEQTQYMTIHALFTRRLKQELRPVAPSHLVHPVDGVLTMAGPIERGTLVQAKGLHFGVEEFLWDQNLAREFQNGAFLTYYLCPTDYHRVHSPWAGELEKIAHLPGTLWPVNPWSVAHVPRLFAINERLHFIFRTEWGPGVVAMVGATNVGEMTTGLAPSLVTNRARKPETFHFSPPQKIERGEELGIFNMGSTVVMLLPEKCRSLVAPYAKEVSQPELGVQFGESLSCPVTAN